MYSNMNTCSGVRLYATSSVLVGMSMPYTLGKRTGGAADVRYTWVDHQHTNKGAGFGSVWSFPAGWDAARRGGGGGRGAF